ncbi:hypothetical protein LB526_16940 [Mesorhizobium sp. CA6]|nr:hypothetical protein [Mesorhizobium sp. CA6]MBZ9768443.1 hypothetical protein [Mesorhizobium sp. CA6]MBZ9914200.1 hypothetical protein [Mesorhizobium sp. CA16]
MSVPLTGLEAQFPAVSIGSNGTTLSFVHAWPSTFNIGDYLSSPRHYFDFECYPASESGFSRVLILGGGAFNDIGAYASSLVEADQKIAWGIGRSVPSPEDFGKSGPSIPANFSAFGSRDRALVAANRPLVPCASVMGDIVDIPRGDALGFFLNQNPAVSGESLVDIFSTIDSEAVVGTNSLSETEFRAKFALTAKIVTNSYHVAYWGLLSGRQVALIGYSSKFASILDLFELPDSVVQYQRGDGVRLLGAIERALRSDSFSRLASPMETKRAFRQANVDYAQHLVTTGLFRQIEALDESSIRRKKREIEVWRAYSLTRR